VLGPGNGGGVEFENPLLAILLGVRSKLVLVSIVCSRTL